MATVTEIEEMVKMKQKPWIKGSGEHGDQERTTLVLPSTFCSFSFQVRDM